MTARIVISPQITMFKRIFPIFGPQNQVGDKNQYTGSINNRARRTGRMIVTVNRSDSLGSVGQQTGRGQALISSPSTVSADIEFRLGKRATIYGCGISSPSTSGFGAPGLACQHSGMMQPSLSQVPFPICVTTHCNFSTSFTACGKRFRRTMPFARFRLLTLH